MKSASILKPRVIVCTFETVDRRLKSERLSQDENLRKTVNAMVEPYMDAP